MLHDGRIIYCDDKGNSSIFYATIGGMGLSVEDFDAAIKKDVKQVKAMDIVAKLNEQVQQLSSNKDNFDWDRVDR